MYRFFIVLATVAIALPTLAQETREELWRRRREEKRAHVEPHKIQDEIEDLLSEKLLRNEFNAGDVVELDIADGSVIAQVPKKKRKVRKTKAKAKAKSKDDKEPVAS